MGGRGNGGGHPRRGAYWSWRDAVAVSNYGWVVDAVFALFLGYLVADRRGSAAVLGLRSPAPWETLLIVAGVLLAAGLGMGAASVVAHRLTGIVYARDRAGFAHAGGFDVGRVPMLMAQLGVFGAFWVTARFRPDALGGARTPWVYLLSSTLVGLVATVASAEYHFRARAESSVKLRRRPLLPVGIRVTELSAARLRLSHPKMLFGVTAALACCGMAVAVSLGVRMGPSPATHWGRSDAGKWTGVAIVSALGLFSLFLASNRRILFDKAAQRIEVRDRYVWGRTAPTRLPLQGVSAVVVRRETMGASQLTNVFVRAGDASFPVIIGSRLANNARDHALVIGRFLDVPVYEADRLLAITPDVSVADILAAIDDLRQGGQEHRAGS